MTHRQRARSWAASPPEILALVASHLPNPSHRAECVLVSKAWSELWTPLLWRSVVLSSHAQCLLFLSPENRPALQRHAHHIRFLSTPAALDLGNLFLVQPELQNCQFLHELDIEFPLPPLPIRRRRGRRGGVFRPPPAQPPLEGMTVPMDMILHWPGDGVEAAAEATGAVDAAGAEVVVGAAVVAGAEVAGAEVAAEAEAEGAAAAPAPAGAAVAMEMETDDATETEAAVTAALAATAEGEAVVDLADAIMDVAVAPTTATTPPVTPQQGTAALLRPLRPSYPSPSYASPNGEENRLPLDLTVEWIRRNPGLKHLSLKGDFDELKIPSAPDFVHPTSNTPTLFHRLESSSLVSLTLDFQQNHSNQRYNLYGNILRSASPLPVMKALMHFSIRGFSGNDDLVLSFLERSPNLKEIEFHAWLSPSNFLKKMASVRPPPKVSPSTSLTSLSSNTSSLSLVSNSSSSSSFSSLSSSSLSPYLVPLSWSSIYLQKIESMVWDGPRELTDKKLSRLFGAAESAFGWKRLTLPRLSKGFGPLSKKALMKYVTRIESLVVGGIQGFDSRSIQQFLESATSLKRFEGLNREDDTSAGSCLRAYDLSLEVCHLYDAEETEQDISKQDVSAPWACAETLKSLAVLITDVPRSDICCQFDGTPWDAEAYAEYWVTDSYVQHWGSNTAKEWELLRLEEDMHRRAYIQLGKLKCLQELYLGQTPGIFAPVEEPEPEEAEEEHVVVAAAAVQEVPAVPVIPIAPEEGVPAQEPPAEEPPTDEPPPEEAPQEAAMDVEAEVEVAPPPEPLPLPQDEALGILEALDAWLLARERRAAHASSTTPARSRNTMRPFQYGCLRLSLDSGLDLMKDLKQLRVLDVNGMAHRIGARELDWMHVNWPRLRWIEGLLTSPSGWADEAFQTQRKQEVETWLQEHPWGIGSSYY